MESASAPLRIPHGRWMLVAACAILLLGVEAWILWRQADRVPIVFDSTTAAWIKTDLPVQLSAQPHRESVAGFARVFASDAVDGTGPDLRLRAYGSARVYLNETLVAQATRGQPARLDVNLGPDLRPGQNLLLVVVSNDSGPPLLHAESSDSRLHSGAGWHASTDGKNWPPALTADARQRAAFASGLVDPVASLRQHWSLWLGLFALGCVAAVVARRQIATGLGDRTVQGERWLLLGALAALLWHNLDGLRPGIGMDLAEHFAYLNYVLDRAALPLGNEGWQMFQPPLAYLLNAGLLWLGGQIDATYALDPLKATRGVTMLVSLVAAYFGARTVEVAFAGRPAQQALGVAVAVSLPASIYMAHAFGNETYFACCAAIALYRLVAAPPPDSRPRYLHAATLGLICGLALLAKTSAVLLAAVLVAALAAQSWRRDRSAALKEVAVFSACCTLVAGWWYLRNLVELGRPFVGGWEQGRGIDWWQYPGYRTVSHLLTFGAVFEQPVFSGVAGFWDGVYSSLWGDAYLSGLIDLAQAPNWNLPAMASLYVLALPLTLAIVAGILRVLLVPGNGGTVLATGVSAALLLLFLAAMLHLYATVPIYSAAKGSYLTALAPCLGILAAWGAQPLLRHPAGQAAAAGMMSAWIGAVGLSFLALGGP